MARFRPATAVLAAVLLAAPAARAQRNPKDPTWWDKYTYLAKNAPLAPAGPAASLAVGANVDVSNECGPQSETYVTLDTGAAKRLAAGSNEIYRLPMRGYWSADGGKTWGGVDLPLPPPIGANGIDFGSDPTLAFDSRGNVFYGYIVVYFSNGAGINGTAMAVARSADGGKTYPAASTTFFAFEGGQNHFNDKPMITADANRTSPYRDSVYVAWDAASGGSAAGGGVRLARSTDGGATFTTTRIDDPSGPGRSIGAVPFVGPNGDVYAAWNDYRANAIVFNRSFDGGVTWDVPRTLAPKTAPFQINVPAEFNRGALVYPACDADRSTGRHRGRLACAWMDLTPSGNADVLLSFSDDQGSTWSPPARVADAPAAGSDRFNPWLSVDPTNGEVNVSFYDTRNDTTGGRYETDIYLARSSDGGATFGPNVKVTTARSNEHDCGGAFPCAAINYGNQQGDYSGLVAYGGVAHPIWTDSRRNQTAVPGCSVGAMEEVFTASVK
jgi:hypothetical protein